MKIATMIALGLVQLSVLGQDGNLGKDRRELIREASEKISNILFITSSDMITREDVVNSSVRQIGSGLKANDLLQENTQTDIEVIKKLITEKEKQGHENAIEAKIAYEKLIQCQELLGVDKTRESVYVENYVSGKTSIKGSGSFSDLVAKFTLVNYEANKIMKNNFNYLFDLGSCKKELKKKIENKKCSLDENDKQQIQFNEQGVKAL